MSNNKTTKERLAILETEIKQLKRMMYLLLSATAANMGLILK